MEPILNSILDNDLYKFTQQQAVLEIFPEAKVSYRFKNRGKQRFNVRFLELLKQQIGRMGQLSLTQLEYSYIKGQIPFFKPAYLEYLKNYRYDPNEVEAYLCNNDLVVDITGSWHSTILWEVPLMALISELYFKTIEDNEWGGMSPIEVYHKAGHKSEKMMSQNINFADFGTRRRRSHAIQKKVIEGLMYYDTFIGTSNVYFAMEYGIKPIGTMSHEWIQAMQSLESLNHCNYAALNNWIRVYNADLGIALTDTIGTPMFFKNFNKRLARDYDGVRHDSGCPFKFIDNVVLHYKSLGINPMNKVIIFSDGLNVDRAIEIKEYCEGKIRYSFGIGTHLTNDFDGSPALNMVIKLWEVNGFPVVKLSDIEGKENGDDRAVDNMKWIVRNQLSST